MLNDDGGATAQQYENELGKKKGNTQMLIHQRRKASRAQVNLIEVIKRREREQQEVQIKKTHK